MTMTVMPMHRFFATLGAILLGLSVFGCEQLPTSNDTEKPTVSISTPGANSTATDSIIVTVIAQDNVAVARVEVFLTSNVLPLAVDTDPPYVLTVPLADVSSGTKQFFAVATDAAGNQAFTASVPFTAVKTPGLKFLSSLQITGSAKDVAASGNLAVLAAEDGGVIAVDISNIYVPRYIGSYRTGNAILGVAIALPVVYAGAGDGTVLALSASNPDTLISTARLVVSGISAGQLAVGATTLSVAGGGGGLLQLAASQVDTLIELGKYDQGGDVRDVELVGIYAYTAEYGQGMRVIDVSQPDSMNAVFHYITSQSASDLYVAASYAYLADGANGVQAFSISNPASPVAIGSPYNTGGNVSGIKGQGRWLFTANGAAGVAVIDANSPISLQPAAGGVFNTAGFANKVAAANGYVLVADGNFLTILKYVEP